MQVSDYEKWLRENEPNAHADLFFLGSILLTTTEQFELHQRYLPQFFDQR